ncbi:hypothetical protein HanHA300_Chr16g0607191 [Helianthus annuus]|nr:hypothetical protein HanHA300_Chr16g0607191 [Helianthus annuus]KAJ0460190.1 hypothetical protein HanHA89_Chr16g0657791 [Helianthus annuus]KAJ0640629.1 hypothetical protein HanLR1_Chr16g0617771 [Helianthus annuus]
MTVKEMTRYCLTYHWWLFGKFTNRLLRINFGTKFPKVGETVTPVSPRPSNKYQADEILYFILGILYKYVYVLHISIIVQFQTLHCFLEHYTQTGA